MNPPVLKNLKTSAAVAAGALALSVFGAAPAIANDEPMGQQAPQAPQVQQAPQSENAPEAVAAGHRLGKVIARTGVNIRKHPNTWSKIIGGYPHGAIIKIKCKVKSQNIQGNDRWYKLAHRDGWVAARWVKNLNYIPWCR